MVPSSKASRVHPRPDTFQFIRSRSPGAAYRRVDGRDNDGEGAVYDGDDEEIELGDLGSPRTPPDKPFVMDEEFERIVQDVVPTTDDPKTPSLTFRVWVLGTLFCVVLAYINQLFVFRTSPFSVSSYVATLLAYPLGTSMAALVPRRRFRLLGFDIDTNPGPFTVKEHVLIGIFGTTGASGVYGSENLIVQEVFYKLFLKHHWAILFLFATSTLGFGISGVSRAILIRPAHMVWPSILPSVALYTAFHNEEADTSAGPSTSPMSPSTPRGRWRVSRLTMLGIGMVAMAAWQLIGPGYAANMLAYVPLLCWLAPGSTTAQTLGSPKAGTGILALTLDWTVVTGGAMSVPFWAAANMFASAVLFQWILTPLAWRGNWFAHPPLKSVRLNSSALSDKDGEKIAARDLVDPESHKLIEAQYAARKPFYLSEPFSFAYFGSMAQFTAALSHTAVWYGGEIWKSIQSARRRDGARGPRPDIHCRLMDRFPEVPQHWYYGFFVLCGILTTIVCDKSGIAQPWYLTLLAIVVAIIGTIPIAVVLATTGVPLFMNVISEFIVGIILPGSPIVMMTFKTLAVSVSSQCLTLLSDLKLAHYMKIPPRHVFVVQMAAQMLAVVTCYGSLRSWLADPEKVAWVENNGQGGGTGAAWGATSPNIFYNASLIWGAIGPIRFFFESVYAPVIVGGLIIGGLTPVVCKIADTLMGPGKWPWRLIGPLVFTVSNPGQNQGIELTSFLVSAFFQHYVYRKHPEFWKRYNYVLASAFDGGAALTTLFTTFVLVGNGIDVPEWLLNAPEDTTNPRFGPVKDWCQVPPLG